MRARWFGWLVVLLVGGTVALRPGRDPNAEDKPTKHGALVIVGGGGTPSAVRARYLTLAGGKDAKILVFPQASRRSSAGADARAGWVEAGATHVIVADLSRPDEMRRHLDDAAALWFSGGSQVRLMAQLEEAGLLKAIRARHAAGVVVGGTSAGAAAMGLDMLTGKARLDALQRGATERAAGLGLWPEALVDQHFHRRRRFNRLLSAVLDDPRRVGIGIDERTAVIVRGSILEVLGASSVLVIDAREAEIPSANRGDDTEPCAARNVSVSVLRPGDRWSSRAP